METYNPPNPPTISFEKLVDIIIRLGVLLFLVGWCFTILSPFVLILIWAGCDRNSPLSFVHFFSKDVSPT